MTHAPTISYTPPMPTDLTPKQSTAAMLLALGSTHTEVAEKINISALTISKWMKLPHFQDRLATYRQQMFDRLNGATVDEVMADAPNTFKRLREHRDQTKDSKASLGACRILFDRQIPARSQHEESHTIRIVLEKKEEQFARAVLAEDLAMIEDAEVIDGPPAP